MDPKDPDLQHWNKSFYLVLYMTFCGVVYMEQYQFVAVWWAGYIYFMYVYYFMFQI